MASFREKFGLDYLRGTAPSSEAPPEMEEAIIAYSRPLLDALNNSPQKTCKEFEMAKNLKLRLDDVIPVVKYLIGKNYVSVVEADELGNDTLTLTPIGQKLLISGSSR